MAYDRFERERRWRQGRPEFSDERGPRGWERDRDFDRGPRGWDRDRDFDRDREDRGFFERMGDEVRSWFGDEEPPSRRELGRDRDFGRSRDRDFERDYRPMAGDYSRSGSRNFGDREVEWDRDPYRRTSLYGSRPRSGRDDPHYEEWRRRQVEDLDRDYDEFRRERQSRFEDDFGSWRDRRMSKRQLLGGMREHMEVVGNDDEHVGTVDRIAGDRIILTRSDPDSGGVHHSLSCADVDRVEGDRVILDCSAEKARERWRDENRSRALFEREDQGRAGPHVLDRSFSGTYR
jgi:hypothetical protein